MYSEERMSMRILGITDFLLKEELLDKGVKTAFPDAEVRYIRWPPATRDIFSRENLNIEKNGAEKGLPVPGILEIVGDFDPEVIVTQFAPVTQAMIEKAKSLEVIGCLRGGVENINIETARKRNILVFNNSGRNANAVAEFTIGHMIALSRGICSGFNALTKGEWWRPEADPFELYGCTVGLIGFGNISQKLSERLQGFKVKILTYDPYVDDNILNKYGAKRVELRELLTQSDFVSLHCRLTTETRNIINEGALTLMKPTSYLINTARAGLIDKTALINALQTRQIRGAALDVFWQEPLSKDDPLLNLNNVSLTPHLAGNTAQTRWLTIWLFLEALQDFLKTRQSRSIINFDPTEQTRIAANMKLVKSAK